MDIRDELELQDCPFCGGPGLLEEENGWCWYVMCMDCGAQTAHAEYKTPARRHRRVRRTAGGREHFMLPPLALSARKWYSIPNRLLGDDPHHG